MRKLLLCTLLLMPLSCFGKSDTIPTRPLPCQIPALYPEPEMLSAADCGGKVCLSIDDAKEVATYIERTHETRLALAGCPLVTLVDQ